MSKIYIGIDPDLIKSGLSSWDKDNKILQVEEITFYKLVVFLKWIADKPTYYKVFIEAGWLNKKSNFRTTQNKATGEAIARNVGENHAVGKLIAQVCAELEIEYKLVKPTQSKTSRQYFEQLTGLKVKSQEMIDASMLVYGI